MTASPAPLAMDPSLLAPATPASGSGGLRTDTADAADTPEHRRSSAALAVSACGAAAGAGSGSSGAAMAAEVGGGDSAAAGALASAAAVDDCLRRQMRRMRLPGAAHDVDSKQPMESFYTFVLQGN